ncbi:hypothetical protein PIB30_054029 [Stylosanthes scabra]|uniref:Uncharacterized protein n=1 Tax=Stylosanthes scabra TaxID=79078 RepID=A0ABU6YGY5_9FABA|nr:hypothetical protein [Stylosanthes scabra]
MPNLVLRWQRELRAEKKKLQDQSFAFGQGPRSSKNKAIKVAHKGHHPLKVRTLLTYLTLIDLESHNPILGYSPPQQPLLGYNSRPRRREIDQRNNTIQQLEAALRELLERQTREAALASEAVRRAEELARKQQAILDEAEKREKDRLEKLEKLNSKTQTAADHSSKTAESRDRTWKPSTVITRAPRREGNKHPFSAHILAEEIPKKFR